MADGARVDPGSGLRLHRKGQIDASGGRQTSRRTAITGIVLGWAGVALLLAMIAGASMMPWGDGPMRDHGHE